MTGFPRSRKIRMLVSAFVARVSARYQVLSPVHCNSVLSLYLPFELNRSISLTVLFVVSRALPLFSFYLLLFYDRYGDVYQPPLEQNSHLRV